MGEIIDLLLYVAGDAPNSRLALANLEAFCRRLPDGRFRLEVVDVLRSPERALAERVLLTPTLVRRAPLPERRIVGHLGDAGSLAMILGVEAP